MFPSSCKGSMRPARPTPPEPGYSRLATRVSTSRLALLLFRVGEGHHRAGLQPTNRDLVGITRQYPDLDRLITSLRVYEHDRFSIARKNGAGGNADGGGDFADFDVHTGVHARPQARVGLFDLGE